MRRLDVVVVTGTPRSGTTPVGDLLGLAPGVRTLYEPLNFHVGDTRVSRYFEVPGAGGFSAAAVDELVAGVRSLRLRLRPGLFPDDRGMRRALKRVTGSRTAVTYRLCRLDPTLRTIVWKDPFAAFLAERLAAHHGIPVLVTIRPPHAVAASFKRLGWRFDITGLAVRLGLSPADHSFLESPRREEPAYNAVILWRLVNDALLRVSEESPLVRLVDVDRLVAAPVEAVGELYDWLGWVFDDSTARRVQRAYADRPAPERPRSQRAHGGRRDLRAVNTYWAGVLDQEETAFIEGAAGDLWERLRAAAAPPP